MELPIQEIVASEEEQKLRARDPIKREISMEEKRELQLRLLSFQNLSEEKIDQLYKILRRGNSVKYDDAELTVEALDTDAFWELHDFVTNCEKAEHKAKRQAVLDSFTPRTSSADKAAVANKNDTMENNPKMLEGLDSFTVQAD
ncbi:unnamed protein product [Cuscuta epithymum]|uniref:NET domain-containing protein n=1 Tax=Cuscuta epithymum TaxID=186058 RepID=A0AAV0ESK1_9ASTE|nr:unnamed protein product [Cuscuta epithymum]